MEILLDIFIAYMLPLNSYIFLLCLNTKNIKYIIFIGLNIDLMILNTCGLITIIMLILYYISNHIRNYYLYNIIIYLVFIFLMSVIFKSNIIMLLLTSIIPQLICIFLFKKTYD